MKAFLKILCLLLCVSMVIPAALLSCSKDKKGEDGNGGASDKEVITLFADGKSEYTIVRPEMADELTIDAVTKFRRAFSEKFGIQPDIASDWVKKGEEIPTDRKEILIGATNRAESQQVIKEMKPDTFVIKVVNNKLVIVADSTAMLANAIKYFIQNYIETAEDSIVLDVDTTYVGNLDDYGPVMLNRDGSYTISPQNFVVVFDKSGEYSFLRQMAAVFQEMSVEYGGILGVCESKTVNKYEFLLGKCNREDYVAPTKDFLFRDFSIDVKNNTVSINAKSIYGFERAFRYIFECLEDGELTIPKDGYFSAYDYGMGKYADMRKNYENPALDGAWAVNVCHRGDVTSGLPENSIPSYQSCIDLGVDVIETDLQKTADGVWIICHDSTLQRTTTGSGNVSGQSLKQIKSYSLRSKNGGSGSRITEHKVPTLKEVIDLCHGHTLFNLDKLSFDKFQSVYDEFEKEGAVDMAMFKSRDSAEMITNWFCELILAGRELPLYSPLLYSNTQSGIVSFRGLTNIVETGSDHPKTLNDFATENSMRLMCLTALDSSRENVETYSQLINVQGYGSIMTDDPVKLSKFIHG